MSTNTDPTRGCSGKKQYRGFKYAKRVVAHAAELNNEPMHAYHCRRCNAFHVGSHFRQKKPIPTIPEVRDERPDAD